MSKSGVTTQAEGIQRIAPKNYDGKRSPPRLDDWIRDMEKVFATLKTFKDIMVDLVVHYLTDDADTWWVTYRDGLLQASSAFSSEHSTIVPSPSWSSIVSVLQD